jgi:uncharacterized protein (DUF2249 family)
MKPILQYLKSNAVLVALSGALATGASLTAVADYHPWELIAQWQDPAGYGYVCQWMCNGHAVLDDHAQHTLITKEAWGCISGP